MHVRPILNLSENQIKISILYMYLYYNKYVYFFLLNNLFYLFAFINCKLLINCAYPSLVTLIYVFSDSKAAYDIDQETRMHAKVKVKAFFSNLSFQVLSLVVVYVNIYTYQYLQKYGAQNVKKHCVKTATSIIAYPRFQRNMKQYQYLNMSSCRLPSMQ